VGTEAQKFSFPDGMSTVPLTWRFLGEAIPMQAWSARRARVPAKTAAK
jgi:hypothetical protein